MPILADKNTRVLIQGITGNEGRYHAGLMKAYGTRIVAGVTPGKGGQSVEGVPVFDRIEDARRLSPIDATVLFVPPRLALPAVAEAVENRIPLIVFLPEGFPLLDAIQARDMVRGAGLTMIGPNCPGLLVPGQSLLGVLAVHHARPGRIGVLSRSGTLTAAVCQNLFKKGYGQSTVVGLGGDPVVGSSFAELLLRFERDPETAAVVLVGEPGGAMEEDAAELIAAGGVKKPVVAYVAGSSAPEGKRMGHAGAIIRGGKGTIRGKIEALKGAGVPVAEVPWEIGDLLRDKGVMGDR